jgi:hypothetical protein
MSELSTNLGLILPVGSDAVRRETTRANLERIDALVAEKAKIFSLIPRYLLKHSIVKTHTIGSDFTAIDPISSFVSFGTLIFKSGNYDGTSMGSVLFEMKIYTLIENSVYQKIRYVDDNVYIFMDGSLIASSLGGGPKNVDVQYNFTVGEHTIQIVLNNSASSIIELALLGDIVDGAKNVFVAS